MNLTGFILASVLLTLMPGPDILFVLSQGLTRGIRPAVAVSAGLASGLLVHTAAAALGLSLIVSRLPVLLEAIRYAGVLYLAYMGMKAFLSRNRPPAPISVPDPASDMTSASGEVDPDMAPTAMHRRMAGRMYRVGVTMNLLNPKVILFFLALFPQFLDPSSESPKIDIFLLGAIFSAIALAIFSTVAFVSGSLGGKFSLDRLSHKVLGLINAFVFWGIAVVFLFA